MNNESEFFKKMYNVPFFYRVLSGVGNPNLTRRQFSLSLNNYVGNDKFDIRFLFKTVSGTVIVGGNIYITRNDTDEKGNTIEGLVYYEDFARFNAALVTTGINGVDFNVTNITPTQITVTNNFTEEIYVYAWFNILNTPISRGR